MIPLIFIALALGVALTAYEFSPGFHTRVDDYVRALRAAQSAHDAADVHLADASVAVMTAARHEQAANAAQQLAVPPSGGPGPSVPHAQAAADMHAVAAQTAADAGTDHVVNAQAANQAAAKHTAEAAKNAKTAVERQEVANSAGKVLEREKKIGQALASLGIGQCGVRTYTDVTSQGIAQLLSKLHAEGMAVIGDNPWNIDTQQYAVKLRAGWDSGARVLKLIVTTGAGGYGGLVTCEEIWKRIDPIVKGILGG